MILPEEGMVLDRMVTCAPLGHPSLRPEEEVAHWGGQHEVNITATLA